MAKRRRWPVGTECAYCGIRGKMTEDHIPPQCLFPENKRTAPVSVPCCEGCRPEQSKDDEYFFTVISTHAAVERHSAVRRLLPTVERALRRPDHRGLVLGLLRNAQPATLMTQSGLYVAPTYLVPIHANRLQCVPTRIVRGLYYHVTRSRLPSDHCGMAIFEEGLLRYSPNLRDAMLMDIEFLKQHPPTTLGTDVFSYWYWIMPEDPRQSIWLMEFYGRMRFFGLTGAIPRAHQPAEPGAPS
jgi:hypothetical protein